MGSLVIRNLPVITRASGVVIIALGLAMLGVVRVPVVNGERRFDLARIPTGPGPRSSWGWPSPSGGRRASVRLGRRARTAAVTETAAWGALLLAFYSLGLG